MTFSRIIIHLVEKKSGFDVFYYEWAVIFIYISY